MFIVAALKPRTIVELGTHFGDSYCAFCQAVQTLSLATTCYAVDTWQGDPQTGFYGAEVLDDLRAYHEPLYDSFSTLIQATFDDAVDRFEDGSIDLLHIDGLHTYEATKHDFETWLPKVSNQGIVLFHDINAHGPGFGVWQLWEELERTYSSFMFPFSYGLGVIAVGSQIPPVIRQLFDLPEPEASVLIRFFEAVGDRTDTIRLQLVEHELSEARKQYIRDANDLRAHAANLKDANIHLTEHIQQLQEQYARDTAELRAHASNLKLELCNLGKHCDNLEEALGHTRRGSELHEERWARDTGELRKLVRNLQGQIDDLRKVASSGSA